VARNKIASENVARTDAVNIGSEAHGCGPHLNSQPWARAHWRFPQANGQKHDEEFKARAIFEMVLIRALKQHAVLAVWRLCPQYWIFFPLLRM
jgi:hypothetical protein